MATQERHLERFAHLKEDAEREPLNEETRVEAYFLAAFHLIDACAAKRGVHLGKHQTVRGELEANEFVFGARTPVVAKLFLALENRLRPKFIYGFAWTPEDFSEVRKTFDGLEEICWGVL